MKSIFEYDDYRAFLDASIQQMKEEDQSFSIAKFSKLLDLSHTSSINKVLRGQRSPGKSLTQKICDYFSFSPEEEGYFRDLLLIEKERSPIQKAKILSRLKKLNNRAPNRDLTIREFSQISNWYTYAITEMIRLKDFKLDFEWIAKKLQNKVSPKEVEDAIERLKNLNMIKVKANEVQIVDQRHQTTNDISSEDIRSYHKQVIKKGADAITQIDLEKRYIASSTMAVKKESINEAKKLIDQFQDNMAHLLEVNQDAEDVYVLNIQYFPLT